ncbi:unnamed protein product, partial [Hapterophycus canaliculatus]
GGGGGGGSDSGSISSSSSSTSSTSSSSTDGSSGSDAAAATAPNSKTRSGDGGRRKRRSSSASFYDYWSFYNSHPASVIRSGTKEMVDDILSSASDDCTVSAPAPSPLVTIPSRQTLTKDTSRGGSTAARSGASITGGGISDEDIRAQGAQTLAKTGGVVTATARRAKDSKLRLEELRKHSENGRCADCSAPCADWASVAEGCFVCLKCAAQHRKLGMHVTFTRSLTMDKWTEESLRAMEAGGNERLAAFVRRVGLYPWSTIKDKYTHPCLPLYRQHLVAVAEGKEPSPLSREALEQARAVLTASGEEGSYDEDHDENTNSNDGKDCSGRSNSRGAGDTTDAPLKSFVKNVGNGYGGIRHAFQQWSCHGGEVGRRAPAGAKGRGGVETGAG